MVGSGVSKDSIIAFTLDYDETNKAPAALVKTCVTNTLKVLLDLGVENILVADSTYFKKFAGVKKSDAHLGELLPCAIKGYESIKVGLTVNYQALFHNPAIQDKLNLSLDAFCNHLSGTYKEIGADIIHSAEYPDDYDSIRKALQSLHQHPVLTVDIETFSLKFWEAGIGTIGFAWDKHNGISFCVDYRKNIGLLAVPDKTTSSLSTPASSVVPYGKQVDNRPIKYLLKEFFDAYRGKLIFHNAGFDTKVAVYELYMCDMLDLEGMLKGIEAVTRHFEDTKLITYLATNTTAGNNLKLKDQSYEFAGSYAQDDIKDIRKIEKGQLLKYNLTDCLSTWYVYEKHINTLVADDQTYVYNEIFLESVPLILQMELTGMPMDMAKIFKATQELTDIRSAAQMKISDSPVIRKFTVSMRKQAWVKKNLVLKTKVKPLEDFDDIEFNPGSNKQLQELLYRTLGFEVTDRTKSKQPATGAKVLAKLVHRTDDQEIKDLLETLIEFIKVDKILTTFMKAFLYDTVKKEDGVHYLHGNFNLGGTVSGRLSCVAGWTEILTPNGNMPITDLRIGDKVWTHRERWRTVTNTIFKGVDEMYDIHLTNGEVLTCTTEHRLLLSDNTWATVGDILNVNIKKLDNKPEQHNQHADAVQGSTQSLDDCRCSGRVGNYFSQCFSSIKRAHGRERATYCQVSEVLGIQDGHKKSYARQMWNATSQLFRRGGTYCQRLLIKNTQREETTCTSYSNDGTPRIIRVARNVICPPYKWGQARQSHRQPCPMYTHRAQKYPLLAGRDQCTLEIKEIHHNGSHEVYDITVEEDASYLAHGVYSHNSSNVNLQNLPSSGTPYAKIIKACFVAPPGFVFGGADFFSLEDRISALTTKDKNKLKVYTDHYDGHCLRAFSYFPERLPGIIDTVSSINSIQTLFPEVRQDSKEPTFLLTYRGTYHGLVNTVGMSPEVAKRVEANYHDLYKESDDWVDSKLKEAHKTGYVVLAFGMRLRTPVMKQTLYNLSSTPYEAMKEGRTAGNALGQSYGMLNNRAAIEFRKRVLVSPYRLKIRPTAMIHDATYFMFANEVGCIEWANKNLIECMEWQELDAIRHDEVKLGGNLELYPGGWHKVVDVPNNATKRQLIKIGKEYDQDKINESKT